MATNNILYELFAQILHSEEKAKERTEKLKQVNDEIEYTQARSSEIMEEIKSIQGNLVIKNQKIAEQELQFKWLTKKRKILAEQKEEMEKKKMELLTCLNNIHEDSETERNRFIGEAEQFSSMYDLISDGKKKREITRKKKLEELIMEKQKLKIEIDAINKEKNEIHSLESKKEKVLSQIKGLESKQKGISNLVKDMMEKTEELEIEKNKVSKKPQNDQEFQRISSELQTHKENAISLEGICDALRQELEELQQQYYRKQLQKQKKHREQQQRTQQHQKQGQETSWQNQQQWQRQQHQDQNMPDPEEKQTGFAHMSNTQDQQNQRPLFEQNAAKTRHRQYDREQNIDTSNATASRFQQASKKPRFQY